MHTTLKDLFKQLQRLRVTMAEIAESLIGAADDLKTSGTPLNPRLLDECASCSFAFNELVEGVRKVVCEDPRLAGPGDTQNLDQLEGFFEILEQRLSVQERISRAASIIELASRAHSDADIGHDFHSRLEQLVEKSYHALRSPDDDIKRHEVDKLLDGSHVLAAIVTLIANDGSLNDQDADHMADLVEQEFGKKVERAVIRGRFQFATADTKAACGRPEGADNEASKKLNGQQLEGPNALSGSDSPSNLTQNADEGSADDYGHQRVYSAETKRAEFRPQLEDDTRPATPDDSGKLERLSPKVAEPTADASELGIDIPDAVDERLAHDAIEQDIDNVRTPSTTQELTANYEREEHSDGCLVTPLPSLGNNPRSVITELPATCSSFQTFCDFHVRLPDGTIHSAPWKIEPSTFVTDAREVAIKRLSEWRLSHVWILCRAIEECGGLPPVRSVDLTRLRALASDTASSPLSSEKFDLISQRLHAAIDSVSSEPNLRVTLFLEALTGDSCLPLSDQDIDKLVHEAFAFEDSLGTFVGKALKLRAREAFSIDELKSRTEEAPAIPPAEWEKKIDQECKELQEEVKRIWSAGGGKIRTTHSRQGWDEFIAIADENLTDLYSAERALGITLVADKERQVRKLTEQARRICDRREVLHHDRKRFDRLVSDIQQRSLKLLSLLKTRRQQIHSEGNRDEGLLPVAELKSLMKRTFTSGTWDGLLCIVLQRIFDRSLEQEIRWDFTEQDLAHFPDLIAFVDADLIDMPTVIQPELVEHPTRVAAILLRHPYNGSTQGISSLIDDIQSSERHDLLRYIPGVLNESQKGGLKHFQREQAKEINATLTALRQTHRELQQLADPLAPSAHSAISEAEALRERLLDDSLDAPMFLHWLKSIVSACNDQVSCDIALLRQQAAHLPSEDAQRVINKLDTRQFTDALYLLGRESEQRSSWQRETLWRDIAEKEVKEPVLALSIARPSLPQPAQDFLDVWFDGLQGKSTSADRPMRTKFARLIFSSTEKDKDKPSGANESDAFRVPCSNIVEWLSDQKLNPTFLPQLRQFRNLVILSPLERIGSQSLVEQLRAQAAKEFGKDSRDLGVFLAPKLPRSVRDDVIREFNVHGLRAGVIDDLDICRLLNVGGQKINILLGLMEITLEQQPLNTFLPYQRHDGQHVRQEMFVGRREQAREIAETTQYSRLFSGRKLGKSALLSFVQQTYDGGSLASGNTLRALYVSGVGASQEAEFVERILDELDKRLDFAPTFKGHQRISLADMSPTECLVKTFEQFNEERPKESVLVLFDEADLFMERQIADYDIQKEKSLSFAIRSRVEAAKDSAGLPRVRFLFSGYRVTHRSDGAWTGAWGDVLRLAPLDPEDATKLVRGPLERLGVKAADVAPTIAWRCGYQPALIIGFCRQLLQQRSLRDVIDDDAIAVTFESTIVQDEIRSIVDSNFQGNPVSSIVFLATIWTFSDHGASSGVVELPDALYRRLVDVHEDTSWLRAADAKSAINQIEVIVQEFVRRQLIREERSATNVRTYYARFPHHIAILSRALTRDPKGTIGRQIVDHIEGSSTFSKDELAYGVRSLYPFSLLSEAIGVLEAPDPSFHFRAIIFSSDWLDAVPKAELSPENGFREITPHSTESSAVISGSPLVLIADATAETLERLNDRDASLPPPVLVGGASLLRESIRRELEFDQLYCRLSLGRIGRSSLQWWFTRKRAIEFESDGLDQIMKATSGIPILVKRIDSILDDKGLQGANVDKRHLLEVIEQFKSDVTATGERLVQQLSDREKEVVRMVLRLSADATPGNNLAEWLREWDNFFPESQIAAVRPADTVSMRVVQEMGLVPVDDQETSAIERFISVDRNDAIHLLFQF